MMPADLTPEHVYAEKQRAYEQLQTGSHWPGMEEWFSIRDEPQFDLRPYFKAPPVLTARQRLLYGLDRYGTASIAAVAHSSKATASGVEGEDVVGRPRRWQKRLDATCLDREAAPHPNSK